MTDINPVSLGIGLALGYFLGEIDIPLPGGAHFALGYAAGILTSASSWARSDESVRW